VSRKHSGSKTYWIIRRGKPQEPALALVAIFPESQDDELGKAIFEAKRKPVIVDNIKLLRQTIDNSCGLIAVFHCILNTTAANSISKPKICSDFKETEGPEQGHNSILYNAIRSEKGITAFLEESKELETEYQLAVESGETETPDEIMYHYIALVGCQDHKLYELDGERSSPLVKGSSSKMGYILNESEQITRIIDSFTHGGIDCSIYKLRHSME
jgi:ubiquitin carboxyl-terminal hydrolase L3